MHSRQMRTVSSAEMSKRDWGAERRIYLLYE